MHSGDSKAVCWNCGQSARAADETARWDASGYPGAGLSNAGAMVARPAQKSSLQAWALSAAVLGAGVFVATLRAIIHNSFGPIIELLNCTGNLLSLAFLGGGIAVIVGNSSGPGILKVVSVLAIIHVTVASVVNLVFGEALVAAVGLSAPGIDNAAAAGFLGFLSTVVAALSVLYNAAHVIYCIALFRAMSFYKDAALQQSTL